MGVRLSHKRQHLFGDAASLERHFHHEHLVHALAVGNTGRGGLYRVRDHEALDVVDEGLAQRGAHLQAAVEGLLGYAAAHLGRARKP